MKNWGGQFLGAKEFLHSAMVALVLLLGPTVVMAQEDDPSVMINEIMWDGTEYVELRNMTSESVSLSGWKLIRQRAGEGEEEIVEFDEDDTMAADGFFLIEKSESATTVTADKLTSKLTLLNSGEQLKLYQGSTLVDVANDTGAWFAGENTEVGVAMERKEGGTGDEPDGWQTSIGNVGGRQGTPGQANSQGKVNHEPEAVAGEDMEIEMGESISLSAEDSSDEDGDTLNYSWDLGDGTTSSQIKLVQSYTKAGKYTVTLTVSDGQAESQDSLIVNVASVEYSLAVVINEFLPDPTGSDTSAEFIELKNTGSSVVDLSGWHVDDAEGGSTPYTIPTGTVIAAGEVMVFMRSVTKLALNNSTDSVRLLSPDKKVQHSQTYDETDEGVSFNRLSASSYELSSLPTPGEENIIKEVSQSGDDEGEEGENDDTSSSRKNQVAGTTIKKVELKNIRSEEKGSLLEVAGVVSVPPRVLGEQIMYLSGSGAQVYWKEANYPELEVGDKVRVVGELSSFQGEARLKITEEDSLEIVGEDKEPTPHVVKTGEVNEKVEGWLVTVAGHVSRTSGDTFYLDDGSGQVKIFIKQTTGIDKPKMKKGDALTVTGVVSRTTSGYRILPRWPEDLRSGLVAGLSRFPATGESTHQPVMAGGLLSVILLLLARLRREPLINF